MDKHTRKGIVAMNINRSCKKVFVLAAVLLSASVFAKDRIAIGTSSTGSNPYILGSTVASAVTKAQDEFIVSAQTTAGYNENLGLVALNQIDFGIAFLNDISNAYQGVERFKNVPNKEIFKNLRLAFPFSVSVYYYATLEKSGMQTLLDAKGSRFNINVPSTSSRSIHEALIKALGLSLDDFKIMELSSKDAQSGLKDGIVDIFGESSSIGHMLELTNSVPTRILNVPDDVYNNLNKLYDGTLVRIEIPANSFPGQEEPIHTFGATASFVVNKDASEEMVYAFASAYWQVWEKLSVKDKNIAAVSLDIAKQPRKVPFHPGVIRFLKEKGLLPTED